MCRHMNSDLALNIVPVVAQGQARTFVRTVEPEFWAIESERHRVAKELHDEILPLLARLKRHFESKSELRTDLNSEQLGLLLDQLVADIRDLLGELHPVDLEEFGIVSALNNLCSRYSRQTNLCILFVERVEEFDLGVLQQLCLYRAVQDVLQMFSKSENDILILTCDHMLDTNFITIRCVDKKVSSAQWLSTGPAGFSSLETCCKIAGASLEIGSAEFGEFPPDLIISIANSVHRRGNQAALKANSFFERLALETERQRITDNINQLIIPSFKKIKSLAIDLTYTNPFIIEFILRLQSIEASLAAILLELHPRLLSETGLISSIRNLLDRFRLESDIDATFHSSGLLTDLHISEESKFAVYRVIQEALNNIEKHSGASQARVCVAQTAQAFSILIEDNGKGLSDGESLPTNRITQSRGMRNIKGRAAAIQASVTWEPSKYFKTGTCLRITLG